jgi:phosphomannomutase
MAEPIISVSGLRGIVGESLSPDVAAKYVAAFAAELGPGPIVVTRDGRTTGPMVAAAVHAGLCAAGRNVLDGGIAATPTTGVLVSSLKAAGGVQISASHNPPPYNGIKLFNSAGRVIPAGEGKRVLERYRSGSTAWSAWDNVGSVSPIIDATTAHFERVVARVDVAKIREAHFRVLLDSCHGAGSILGKKLLAWLGCDVVAMGDTPDGKFEHTPEPTAENLVTVSERAESQGCHVGFCQDPDADRLALLDETGRYIGEEYTLAICIAHELSRAKGPVVINCATSRMTADLAAKAGVPCIRSAVGEANVVDQMLANKAVFGGEGNGGPIDPNVGFVRDSFVGMAMVLDAMAKTKKKVSQLAAEIPKYAIHKDKVTLSGNELPESLARLKAHFSSAKCDTLDGMRFDWEEKKAWLIVRASNTEPIVRIIAEAPTLETAKQLCDETAKVMQS